MKQSNLEIIRKKVIGTTVVSFLLIGLLCIASSFVFSIVNILVRLFLEGSVASTMFAVGIIGAVLIGIALIIVFNSSDPEEDEDY